MSSSVANIDRPSTCTVCTAKLMPMYRMTASRTTSASSRRNEEPVEARGGLAATAGCCGAAMSLGDELSADPLQLFPTRVAKFDLSAVESACDFYRYADARLDAGGDVAELRGRVVARQATRFVRPHPVLGLTYGQPFCNHHLQAMLLRRLALQRDQRARVTGRDRARGDGGLHGRAPTEQAKRLGHGDAMLADALRDLFVCEVELLGQALESARFFDGIEVGALKVLDKPEHKLCVVAGVVAHHGGHRVDACESCRAPSPLTRDQLVAVCGPSHEKRLQHTVLADRFRELSQRFGIKARPHLLMRGP